MSVRVGESDVVGKSGKKGKRSKKIEKGGVDEVRDGLDVEEGGIVKSKKKGKRGKMDVVEEVTDHMDVEEDGIGKSRKKGKKSKKKEMVGVGEVMDCLDVEVDGIENSRKKGKKIKNKDIDGVGEVTDRVDVEEDGIGKSRKKGKKSKEETDGVEEMNDQTNVENEQNLETRVENKKKKKGKEMVAGGESMTDTQDKEYVVEKWKKKKTKTRKFETFENQDALNEKTETEAKESNSIAGNVEKKKKKRKRTLEEDDDDNDTGKKKGCYREDVGNSLPDDNGMVAIEKVKMKKKKKKRQRKNEEITEMDGLSSKAKDNETTNVPGKEKKTKSVMKDPENPKSKEKKKVRFSNDLEEVRFSDDLEVVPSDSLVQGKRFTPEEDETLRAAVEEYIQSHCLGEKGVEMVMKCISHRKVRNCWNEIRKALPYRPKSAIYSRAHTLFERGETHEWTEEEKEMLLEQYKKHGNNWSLMAKDFKRHRLQVKDTYRRIKMKRNKGHWSQEEYQTLFDHVNIDLRAKLDEEKKSKHGMLRDNICWTAISDKLSTRADSLCCMKWYNQLTSPMVSQGIWADSDDYRLLDALFNLDACCIEDVDWDNLIEHRSGDVCRKRWDQMVLHIGLHGVKSFAEQVEVLANRYRPELTEAREAWDSKPLVP